MPRAVAAPTLAPVLPARDRWVCLAGGCALIICAGAVYGFGAIAADLKRQLKLDDSEQQTVGMMGNCGLWLGSFLGGVLADARGPRVAMLAGALLFIGGYGGMYLALADKIPSLRHYQFVAALWLCCGLGSGFVYNATIFTNSQNFGQAGRARIIGMLATLFGASSTIWSTAFR